MTRIVCQAADKPARITLVWSAGAAAFEPIHIEAGALSELRNVAASIRQRLAAGLEPGELGGRLFAQLFLGSLGAEIAGWLRDLDGRGEIESLEVASDAPGEIPWTAVDDPQRPGAWGRRFALCGGHRVHPLRSFPDFVEPKLLAVLHPALEPALADEVMASLSARQAPIVHTREELLARLHSELPDVLWIVAPATDAGWRLDQGVLTADDLARALARDVVGNPHPLVVSSAFGEANVAALRESLPGLVTSEVATAEGPAIALGRAFLTAFLDECRPLGAALRQVRERIPGQASLAWTAFAPPQVGVRSDNDVSAAPTPTIHPLPAEPFHPLRPLEREDRALLLGREDDILACAQMLDRADASGLWIHGKASVGKASLLRSGLIPFLEEETGGFLAWRERSEVAGPETEAKQPTISARVGRDLCGTIAQCLLSFCAKPLQFVTPTGRTVVVDLPALLVEFAPIVSTAIREGTESPPPVEGAPPTEPPAAEPTAPNSLRSLWTRLNADPAILDRVLDRITRPLPFELVLAFEQGDDLVALPRTGDSQADRRAVSGRLLDVLGRTSARVKSVVTVRTEFFAQVQDVMHDASARQAWQDHYLPEVDDQTLSDILIAPTVAEPLPYSNQNPAAKYEFGFESGVANDVLSKIRKAARNSHVSRLSLLQAVGAGLFELSRRRALPSIRPTDVKKLRVDQAMSELVRGKLRTAVRGTSRGVQSLLDRLMVRHESGIRTRNLISQRSLQEKWTEKQPFKQVIDRLYQAGLLDVQAMAEDGTEGRYVGPPQDSFEVLDVDRDADASRRTYARSKVVDTLFIMVPLALLGMALTYFFVNRRYANYFSPEQLDRVREDIQDKDVSLRMIRLAAYHGMIARADQALDHGDTLRARQLLLSAIPDPGDPRADPRSPDLRGFEWSMLWRKSKMETKNLSGHAVGVRTLSLSANDELLASGDELGKVLLWNLKQGGELGATLVGLKQPVEALAISADAAWVAGCDGGPEVLIWPSTVGAEQPADTPAKSRADVKNARAVAFAGKDMLAIAADEGIVLWDLAAGKEKATLKDHSARVFALISAGDGKFVSASADQAILWNGDGKKAAAVKLKDATIDAVTVAGSNLLIAASKRSGGDGVVHVWDMKDGSTPTVKAKQTGAIRALASLGDDQIATGGDDMTIRVHDLAAGKEVARLYGHLSRVRGLVAAKGGKLASCSSDPTIKLWNAGPASPLRESIPAHDSVQALAVDPSGQTLASGGHDGLIKLWNTVTTQNAGEMKAAGPVTALAFAPKTDDKSTTILAAAVGKDILRWSLSAGKTGFDAKELPALKKHTDQVLCLRFSPDAKFLASGGRDNLVITWDLKDSQARRMLANPSPITAVDAELYPLVIAGDEIGIVRIWDADGRPLDPNRSHGLAVTGIEVMNQRPLIGGFVTSSLDGSLRHTARTQDQDSFSVLSTIRGFAEPVTSFVQGPGFLALAGAGGSVAIVDVSIDEPRFVFRAHPDRINALALAHEQAVLVTGGADGTLRFFRSEPRPDYGPVKYRLFPPRQAAKGDEE